MAKKREGSKVNDSACEVTDVLQTFKEMERHMDDLRLDVAKNNMGTVAAGLRVRKGIRQICKLGRELVKFTIRRDKELRAARPKRTRKVTEQSAPGAS